jgi:hypothetical protein
MMVSLAFLAACGSESAGLGGKTADQVLSLAVTAAQEASSFHFVERNPSSTPVRVLVGDAGVGDAQQTLSAGDGVFEVRLLARVAYLRAPSGTLESVLGLSTAVSSAHAGKWLSLTSGAKGYGQIVAALRPDSELDSFIPQVPLVLGKSTKLHGIAVVPVSGAAPTLAAIGALNARATLFVSTSAPYRPVGGVITGTDVHGRLQSDEVAFTRWGARIRPIAPSGAVSVASLK